MNMPDEKDPRLSDSDVTYRREEIPSYACNQTLLSGPDVTHRRQGRNAYSDVRDTSPFRPVYGVPVGLFRDPRSGLDPRHDNGIFRRQNHDRPIPYPPPPRGAFSVPQRVVSTEESPDVTTHRRRMTSFFPKKS